MAGNQVSRGLIRAGALAVGGGTIGSISRGTLAFDPASINAQVKGTVFATLTGAGARDLYFFEPPATLEVGLLYGGYVPAAGSVGVILGNIGTASVNGGSLNWGYTRFPMG